MTNFPLHKKLNTPYSPDTGRFISRDPFPGIIEKPESLNSYIYSWNDPVEVSNPEGSLLLTGTATALSVLEILTQALLVNATASIALGAVGRVLGPQVEWDGVINGADSTIIVANGRFGVLDAQSNISAQFLGSYTPSGIYSGLWAQLALGVDLPSFPAASGGFSPPVGQVNFGVTLKSPRIIGAQPGALTGPTAFGGASSGTGASLGGVTIGFGSGFYFDLDPANVDASISGVTGVSIPIYGDWNPGNILPP